MSTVNSFTMFELMQAKGDGVYLVTYHSREYVFTVIGKEYSLEYYLSEKFIEYPPEYGVLSEQSNSVKMYLVDEIRFNERTEIFVANIINITNYCFCFGAPLKTCPVHGDE